MGQERILELQRTFALEYLTDVFVNSRTLAGVENATIRLHDEVSGRSPSGEYDEGIKDGVNMLVSAIKPPELSFLPEQWPQMLTTIECALGLAESPLSEVTNPYLNLLVEYPFFGSKILEKANAALAKYIEAQVCLAKADSMTKQIQSTFSNVACETLEQEVDALCERVAWAIVDNNMQYISKWKAARPDAADTYFQEVNLALERAVVGFLKIWCSSALEFIVSTDSAAGGDEAAGSLDPAGLSAHGPQVRSPPDFQLLALSARKLQQCLSTRAEPDVDTPLLKALEFICTWCDLIESGTFVMVLAGKTEGMTMANQQALLKVVNSLADTSWVEFKTSVGRNNAQPCCKLNRAG